MPQVRGVVKQLKEKSGTSKNGKPYTVYSIGVDCGDGNLQWFGAGFDKPQVREESIITFEAGKNKAGYDTVDVSTIQVDKQASGGQGQTQSNAAPAQAQSFGGDRQKSIITQTSFKVAVDVVDTLIANKLLPLPAANSQEKKANAMEAVLQTIDQLAARYLKYFDDPAAFEAKLSNDLVEDAIDEGQDEDDDLPWG